MEKKTRTIGILLLILLVLLITFFGLKKWNTSKSEAEEKKKENAVVHIFETDSLESIEYKEASGEEMSFVKEDDTWEYAPDTTIALTESSMQNMEDAFSDIQAVKEIKNPDDLSDYGFDSPEYNLTLTGKDGGLLGKRADVAIIVPETETFKIQELHLPVYHALCLMLEEYFF